MDTQPSKNGWVSREIRETLAKKELAGINAENDIHVEPAEKRQQQKIKQLHLPGPNSAPRSQKYPKLMLIRDWDLAMRVG